MNKLAVSLILVASLGACDRNKSDEATTVSETEAPVVEPTETTTPAPTATETPEDKGANQPVNKPTDDSTAETQEPKDSATGAASPSPSTPQ